MPDITVIAHNIRSAHNVGSIFRTCEGFGVKQIVLSGYTPYPVIDNDSRLPHLREKIAKQIHKTALDAETMVDFMYVENIQEWLKTNTLPLIALEQTASSINLRDYIPPAALALVLGEEVEGISPELLANCNAEVEIPMYGHKESFNVSVAAGIALYELNR